MTQLLLINQTFYPDQSASAQYLTDLARQLADQGHSVTVLTNSRGYLDPTELYSAHEIYHGIKIVRLPAIAFRRLGLFGKILDAIWTNLCFAIWLLIAPRVDTIIVLTSPPLVAWVARHIAKRPRSRFVYWLLDLNPEQAFAAGLLARNSLLGRVLEHCLRSVLQGSDLIVTLDEMMAAQVEKRGVIRDRIAIIPPWSNTDQLFPVEHSNNRFRAKHAENCKTVVMYSGNHALCHPLDTLLESAHRLRNDPDILFLFVGDGKRRNEVTEYRARFQLTNIVQLPYQPRTELAFSLSAADLHIVTMGADYLGIVHPSKLYGALAVGRPLALISPSNMFLDPSLRESPAIRHFSPDRVDELVAFIRGIHAERFDWRTKCEQARKLAETFGRERLCVQMTRLVLAEDRSTKG